jgi:hypothetical protein
VFEWLSNVTMCVSMHELTPCLSHSDSWLTPTQLLFSQENSFQTVSLYAIQEEQILLTKSNLSEGRSYFTTDGQSVIMSWYQAPLWNLRPHIITVGMFLSEICGLVSVGRFLWQDGSVICSVITQWSESLKTRNHTLLSHLRLPQPGGSGSHIYTPQEQVSQLYLLALGSVYIISYDSQGYCGGILTLPQPGGPGPHMYILQEQDGPVQSQSQIFDLYSKLLYDWRSVSQHFLLAQTARKHNSCILPLLQTWLLQRLLINSHCWLIVFPPA